MTQSKSFSTIRACILAVFAMLLLACSGFRSEAAFDAPYYNINDNGGTWDGTHYYLEDGTMVVDAFFCDGTYTYFLQADGTPMKNRLTYHPDGEQIIYFDAEGREVFDNYANVKTSIAGDPVDDMCYFGTFGNMYVNVLTYNKEGTQLLYANPYGVLERNGWFKFFDGRIGYANTDCTLTVSQFSYDEQGRMVYFQADGSLAFGEITDGVNYYKFNAYEGYLEKLVPVGEVTRKTVYKPGQRDTYYDGETLSSTTTYTYDEFGREAQAVTTAYYYGDRTSTTKEEHVYNSKGQLLKTTSTYEDGDTDVESREYNLYGDRVAEYRNGDLESRYGYVYNEFGAVIEESYYDVEDGELVLSWKENRIFDANGNDIGYAFYDAYDDETTYTYYQYDGNGTYIGYNEYDENNNLLSYYRISYDAATRTRTYQYFDAAGNLLDYNVAQYNENDKVVTRNYYAGDGTLLSTYTYQYNANGVRTGYTIQYHASKETANYVYCEHGNMVNQKEYDEEGNLTYRRECTCIPVNVVVLN